MEGHIVVHRQDQPALPAQHRKLFQKLHIMLAAFHGQPLEIDVHAVQPQPQGGLHHALRQLPALRRGGQHLVAAHVRSGLVLIIEIVPDAPHLQPIAMSLLHVLAAGKGAEIALIVHQAEPSGRDHIDALPLRHHGRQGVVAALAANGMKAQAHLSRQGQGGVLLGHIVRHRRLRLH